MLIDNQGNVGINTTSPTSLLHVNGSGIINNLNTTNLTSESALITNLNNTNISSGSVISNTSFISDKLNIGPGSNAGGRYLQVGTLNSGTASYGNISISNDGPARYHLFNNGGQAEWLLGQKSKTLSNFVLSKLVSGIETDYFTVNVNGNVGINTLSSGSGSIGVISANGTNAAIGFLTGNLTPFNFGSGEVGLNSRPWDRMHASAFNVVSDEREKSNIQLYTTGLEFIKKTIPKTYYYTRSQRKDQKIGFIAQDIIKINPSFEGVSYNEDNDRYSMTMDQFIGPLVNSVKELDAELTSTKLELQILKDFLKSKYPNEI
jgi:hypothetical protein